MPKQKQTRPTTFELCIATEKALALGRPSPTDGAFATKWYRACLTARKLIEFNRDVEWTSVGRRQGGMIFTDVSTKEGKPRGGMTAEEKVRAVVARIQALEAAEAQTGFPPSPSDSFNAIYYPWASGPEAATPPGQLAPARTCAETEVFNLIVAGLAETDDLVRTREGGEVIRLNKREWQCQCADLKGWIAANRTKLAELGLDAPAVVE
jgi:hypothetical protein